MDNDIMIGADTVTLFNRLQMNAKRDIPIRPSEMGVLIFTQKQSEPVTPLMISNFFRISKPSVTSMINSLIKKEYLIKTPSPTDGRSYTVSTSDKGKELVESTYNEYFRTIELLKNKMGDKEFNSFIQLMQKANSVLSEEI
ncbi:MarR family winged helix-turn-helix transcriptional regulator [Alkaliphilus hydrothermalis]|uniref:DNA-binding MarR family transcriptional regulator n=1 Tax=Alkaliphilus hydrothermalis TaxID=1482730 RepID=A0ABS2NMK2_9FIRM|nr:MarR family transcriptional regulator [Alkaliphilus hydrothermalis]MBM7614155.1 DNA-binding MarR family transcriptional regulator [Alkaliphilus hydrothermalis]